MIPEIKNHPHNSQVYHHERGATPEKEGTPFVVSGPRARRLFWLGAVSFFSLLIGFIFIGDPTANTTGPIVDRVQETSETAFIEARVKDHVLKLEVAETFAQRVHGLSDRQSLAPAQGMLFVFDEVDSQGIWMKDMNFALDIIWLDQEKRVVLIEKDVAPETYPRVYGQGVRAKYVIELPAGTTEQLGIEVTDRFQF